MNSKLKLIFLFSIFFFLISITPVSAAIITINNSGQVVWSVLGDSTIKVEKIAQNSTPSPDSLISLNNSDGKVVLNGMDVTNLKGDLVEIEARGDTNELKIGTSDNKFKIEEKDITALTTFPITVDPVKNSVTVKTNSGDRIVTILPYEATLSLTRGRFLDKINDNKVELQEGLNGELQYEVDGSRDINLFNISKLTVPINSTVSASNGTILQVDEPTWLKILGFLFT